jgi:PEP-CTERM motif
MRRALWIVLAAAIFAMAVPAAHAQTYDGTFNFVTTFGTPDPTSGSFVFDETTNTYTTLTVDWDGAVFAWSGPDVVGQFPASGTWCAAGPDEIASCDDRYSTFSFGTVNSTSFSGAFTDADGVASGTYTVTETLVTPEPSSLVLMLTGIGVFLLLLRKRIAPAGL